MDLTITLNENSQAMREMLLELQDSSDVSVEEFDNMVYMVGIIKLYDEMVVSIVDIIEADSTSTGQVALTNDGIQIVK